MCAEGVLKDAGALSVRSFQTNGTVLVDVGDADARAGVGRAAPRLTTVSGYDDAAFMRPLKADEA